MHCCFSYLEGRQFSCVHSYRADFLTQLYFDSDILWRVMFSYDNFQARSGSSTEVFHLVGLRWGPQDLYFISIL